MYLHSQKGEGGQWKCFSIGKLYLPCVTQCQQLSWLSVNLPRTYRNLAISTGGLFKYCYIGNSKYLQVKDRENCEGSFNILKRNILLKQGWSMSCKKPMCQSLDPRLQCCWNAERSLLKWGQWKNVPLLAIHSESCCRNCDLFQLSLSGFRLGEQFFILVIQP